MNKIFFKDLENYFDKEKLINKYLNEILKY